MVLDSIQQWMKGPVLFAAVLCFALVTVSSPAQEASGGEAAPNPSFVPLPGMVPARPMDTVVAESSLGNFQIQDLYGFYKWWKPPVAPIVPEERVAEMPREWVGKLAIQYALAKAMTKKAESTEDPVARKEFDQRFQEYLLNYAIDEMKKRRITSRIVEPTEQEIAAYYEQHKVEYFQPFQFTMRHLFLSTYEPYTVQAGDTLESIAEKISGDPAAVANIRSDAEGRPVRWVPPEEREKKLFKPLTQGEKLLVPMSAEKIGAVEKRIRELAGKIKAGGKFEEIAKAESESEGDTKGVVIGPLPTGVKPIAAELLEAGKKTPKGEISEPFRTKHGWNIIEVVEKKDEGHKTLEQVRVGPLEYGEPGIVDILKKEQESKLELELSNELFEMPEVKVNYELMDKAPNLPDDTVIATVGTTEILWKPLKGTWERIFGSGGKAKDRKEIDYVLRRFPPIQYATTLVWCDKQKIWNEPELSRAYEAVRIGSIGKSWFDREVYQTGEKASTEEAAREYYKNNMARFKVPECLSYQVIELRPGAEYAKASDREKKSMLNRMRKDLDDELNGFRTIDDFLDYAYRVNPPTNDPAVKFVSEPAMKLVDVNILSGTTGEQAKKLKQGQWTEKAYIEGDVVRAVAVTERIPAGQKTFPDAKTEIQLQLRNEARKKRSDELSAELLKEIGFKIVLTQ